MNMKYSKEMTAWMNGEIVQWKVKHEKIWNNLPHFDLSSLLSCTFNRNGLESLKYQDDYIIHFSDTIEFRIKPEPKFLTYRIALIKSNYDYKLQVLYNYSVISNDLITPEIFNLYINLKKGYEFVGWVDDQIKQIDINSLPVYNQK